MPTWQELAATSHYQTAVAVREALRKGNVQDATQGLEELIDALSRADRRALESHLVRLMQHIIKWTYQPDKRSRSWQSTIANARESIAEIQEDTPSLTDDVIRRLWEHTLRKAHREAEGDMNRQVPPLPLSWDEVFTQDYSLDQ
jgi:Domain of unknown function DUF29